MQNLQPVVIGSVVLLACLAFLARPFMLRRQNTGQQRIAQPQIASLKQRADLLGERRHIYATIRDLEMEYRVDKINDSEFEQQRERLVASAVDVLKQLDGLTPLDHDPIEELIDAFKNGQPSASASDHFCANCGAGAHPDDLYCSNCGQALS